MEQTGVISARQIKAARALLDWSQDDLAEATHLSVATIRKLELGFISPRGSTTFVLRRSFEEAGIEFIVPDGVRCRPEDVDVFEGVGWLSAFFDDIVRTVKRSGGDVVVVLPGPSVFTELLREDFLSGFCRLPDIGAGAAVKCLLLETRERFPDVPLLECRALSSNYIDSMPFGVYGDTFVLFSLDEKTSGKAVVVRSPWAAQASRRQFSSMWEKALPLNRVGTAENAPRRVSAGR